MSRLLPIRSFQFSTPTVLAQPKPQIQQVSSVPDWQLIDDFLKLTPTSRGYMDVCVGFATLQSALSTVLEIVQNCHDFASIAPKLQHQAGKILKPTTPSVEYAINEWKDEKTELQRAVEKKESAIADTQYLLNGAHLRFSAGMLKRKFSLQEYNFDKYNKNIENEQNNSKLLHSMLQKAMSIQNTNNLPSIIIETAKRFGNTYDTSSFASRSNTSLAALRRQNETLSGLILQLEDGLTQALSLRTERELCTSVIELAKRFSPTRTDCVEFERHFSKREYETNFYRNSLNSLIENALNVKDLAALPKLIADSANENTIGKTYNTSEFLEACKSSQAKLEQSASSLQSLIEKSLQVTDSMQLPSIVIDIVKTFGSNYNIDAFEKLCAGKRKEIANAQRCEKILHDFLAKALAVKTTLDLPVLVNEAAKVFKRYSAASRKAFSEMNENMQADTSSALEVRRLTIDWINKLDYSSEQLLVNLGEELDIAGEVYYQKRMSLSSVAQVTATSTQSLTRKLVTNLEVDSSEKRVDDFSDLDSRKSTATITPQRRQQSGEQLARTLHAAWTEKGDT